MLPGSMPSSERDSLTGKDARTVVFGHLLRGGTPHPSITSFPCVSALRASALSIKASPVSWSSFDPSTANYVPLGQGTQRMKTIPLDCDTILTARELGISFGN